MQRQHFHLIDTPGIGSRERVKRFRDAFVLSALLILVFMTWAHMTWAQASAQSSGAEATETPPTDSPAPATEGADSPNQAEPDQAEPGQAEAEPADGEVSSDDAPPTVGPTVLHGRIDDEINLSTSAFIKRLVDEATERKVDILLIDLNTFGGRLDAAVAIRDAIMDAPMKTVVYINKRAISAGALISYACETIAISPGGTIGAAMPVAGNGQEIPEAQQEKIVSYFREELRSTAEARGRNPDIAEAMVDRDKVVEDVTTEGKLLTLGTTDAVRLGVADFEAADLDALLEQLGASASGLVKVERSWSEEMAAFLTSQAIASLLLLGMMLFGYLELQTPGFGFFGAAAAFCFLLLYFSHYLTNLAGHEELLLFALGMIFLAVELLLLPGVGVFAILGTLSILASVVLVLSAGDWSDFSFQNPITMGAMQQVAVVLVVSFFMLLLLVKYMAPISGKVTRGGLMLAATLSTDAGYTSFETEVEDDELIGLQGTALTQLRPSGKARFDGQRLNVETEGDWIDKSEQVVIVRRAEGRLIVRRA